MMEVNKIYQGDALSILQTFPDNSIDMCMTSPPYWGLRDYGVEQIFGGDKNCKHEWIEEDVPMNFGGQPGVGVKRQAPYYKDGWGKRGYCLKCRAWKGQLGLEPTPEMYIEHMTEIFHEVKRVLKKEGTLWVVIGDTYWGGGNAQGHTENTVQFGTVKTLEHGAVSKPVARGTQFQSKCLCMIPECLAWAMIQDGWILRNKNIWYKHNGMPSSVRDRFSNKYEFVYMFSQAQKYYFDLDAVREAHITQENRLDGIVRNREWGYNSKLNKIRGHKIKGESGISQGPQFHGKDINYSLAGKNPGDVFEINTQPFPEAHFAVYPVKLCEKPIKAGCPKGGIVADPFSGAGTTCYTAAKLGRDFIGIEISEKYKAMSEDRIFGSLFKPAE